MESFKKLYETIKVLRGENGCPWDRKQNIQTMRPQLIEETYEVVDAIDDDNDADLKEELGDLMFLTVFVSYLAEQEERFTVDDVVQTVTEKLIRRHPHVFGDVEVNGVADVLKNWEDIKAGEEKNLSRKSPFDGIPKSLPALPLFHKTLQKIHRDGANIARLYSRNLEIDAETLKNDFNAKNLQQHLKSVLIQAFLHDLDANKIVQNAAREIQSDYIEKISVEKEL